MADLSWIQDRWRVAVVPILQSLLRRKERGYLGEMVARRMTRVKGFYAGAA